MNNNRNYFKRYEKKYIIDETQYFLLKHFVQGRLRSDKQPGSVINNLYYDTRNYDLIRASIEKPVYKEKLRLRVYGETSPESTAYVELKKKLDGIVHKRRFKTTVTEGMAFLAGGPDTDVSPMEEHILMEVKHFLSTHDVMPRALISYDREALHGVWDPDFRMTFDSNLVYNNMDSLLGSTGEENFVLEPGKMVMELKTPTSVPIWLSKIMSELDIYPSSFSKYGEAYKIYIHNKLLDDEEKKKEVGLSA